MLFHSTVPDLIRRLNIRADSKANQLRKLDTVKRLDLYTGKHAAHLEEQLNRLFSEPDKLPQAWLNITKKVVNNLAQVYQEPPTRTVEGTDQDREIFAEIASQTRLDVKLKQATRLLKLLKTICIRPVWRNGRMDIDLLTGNILDVETGDTPEDLKKVLITDYGQSNRVQEIEYSLWTAEEFRRLDYRGNEIKSEPNPYGVLPFLPVFDYAPTGSDFWLPGGEDLIQLQEAINLKLTDLLYLLSTQSFGVGWIKGVPGAGNLRVDPGSLVELPAEKEAALGFVHQEARIEEVVAALDWLIKQTGISHGLSAASLSTDPQEASGLSKLVDSRELQEMRRDDIALWRSYEHQLFALTRLVWNVHNPTRKVTEKAAIKLDFADPRPEVEPQTQTQVWDSLLSMGVISPVDIVLERNPDLKTRENALAFLLQLQEESRALSESQSPA